MCTLFNGNGEESTLNIQIKHMNYIRSIGMATLSGLASASWLASSLTAAPVAVTVTVQNLAPINSTGISFAPLRLGFGNGTFDSFNTGTAAGLAIVSVAEGGSGSAWFPAFAAAEPSAVLGSVGGALLPGMSAMNTFIVDPSVNRFFTFGSMVIPSNDLFLGNDNPLGFQVLDNSGNLLIPLINQIGNSIWDANSEVADPANAAFVVGGVNANRTAENGLVAFDFSELSAFNGLTTAAGYVFNNGALTGTTPIYSISFSVASVPEPTSILVPALALGLFALRRFSKSRPA